MDLQSKAQDFMQPPTLVRESITVDEVRRKAEDDPNDLAVVVDDNGAVVGVLTPGDISLAPNLQEQLRKTLHESGIYKTNVVTCSPQDSLERVLQRMDVAGVRTAVVVEGNKPVGVVSRDSLREFAQREFSQFRVKL